MARLVKKDQPWIIPGMCTILHVKNDIWWFLTHNWFLFYYNFDYNGYSPEVITNEIDRYSPFVVSLA